jgi:DNA processing protein
MISDAPPLLWAVGNLSLLARPTVAMVGARNASSLGLRMARTLAEGLGKAGFLVASGLARGIDAAAHAAALPTGTVAVMAGGVDHIYPPENAQLAADIARQGLRLSEHPIGLEPLARHFPARNRIVAGLSLGVVVVEAAERSGSLITARTAADQGREVLAVPGHPLDPRAAGCNALLRDGATLIRRVEDLEEALAATLARWRDMASHSAIPTSGPSASDRSIASPGPSSASAAKRPAGIAASQDDLRDIILRSLGPSPLAEDQLIRDLGLSVATVVPALTDLELEGRILRQPGALLSLPP